MFGKRQLPEAEREHISFFLFTLYIYLQDFKHSHPTSLDAPSSPASVATRYHKSSVAFVHALYYFAWLRPLQPLTGRRRRRYPNSTFKSDFPLHNNKVRQQSRFAFKYARGMVTRFDDATDIFTSQHHKCINEKLVNFPVFEGKWWFEFLQQASAVFVNNGWYSKAKGENVCMVADKTGYCPL